MPSHSVTACASCVFFRTSSEVKSSVAELARMGWSIVSVDATDWQTMSDVYLAFAVAMKMPPGYYGPDEVFAPNDEAFLEYFDDVRAWLPAESHLYVVQHATGLLSNAPELAGRLAELIQLSHLDRGQERNSDAKLVFVSGGAIDA